MIRVLLESGRVETFDDGYEWRAEGHDGEMFVFVMDIRGHVLHSYPLDDVRNVLE